jgi:type I restriction enzyme, S subunit
MKSSYKLLGPYIQAISKRNKDLKIDKLIGLSIQKIFIPSISNTIGTDMSTYKIVRKNQFAYGPVTSRNGNKITIALSEEYEVAIISQAYTVFEIINDKELLPEYLMMWFRRPEFDRYARFKSHGSVREMFDWEEMCSVELPVPNIEKQKAIVKEYNTVINRIKLNKELNKKLEETAQAIYKQWFVDFEFPDENGRPYKSSGGEMVWCEELGEEIPVGWEIEIIKDFCLSIKSGGTPNRSNNEYWNSRDIPWLKTGEIKNNIIINTSEFISTKGLEKSSAKILPKDTVLMSMYGVNAGDIGILDIETSVNQACCGMICDNKSNSAFLYYQLLYNQNFHRSQSIGGAQENLSKDYIEKIQFLTPLNSIIKKCKLKKIVDTKKILAKEDSLLKKTLNILLSKMAKG